MEKKRGCPGAGYRGDNDERSMAATAISYRPGIQIKSVSVCDYKAGRPAQSADGAMKSAGDVNPQSLALCGFTELLNSIADQAYSNSKIN